MDKQKYEIIVGVADLAAELGVSDQTIHNYVAAGLPKLAHGKYDLVACYRWMNRKLINEILEIDLARGRIPLQ